MDFQGDDKDIFFSSLVFYILSLGGLVGPKDDEYSGCPKHVSEIENLMMGTPDHNVRNE